MNEENRFTNAAKNPDDGQRQPSGKVGLRGCWELLIKVIILLILIAILIAYWFGQIGPFGTRGEYDLWAWLILLLMIALLIYLICRQKHFVMLNCGVTDPTGCKHGDPSILAGRVLERIKGTASGIGFSRYELELVFHGTTTIPAGIVYADAAGNPAPALTFGNHQVNSGTLGFVDVQQAMIGAGADFLNWTDYEVKLHVVGIDSSRKHCQSSFQLAAARAYIKTVGGAWAHTYSNPNEQLCRVPPPVGHAIDPASVAPGIYVTGSARFYGCSTDEIAEVHMWAIPDDNFSFAQPVPGTAIVAPPGSQKISEVFYTTAAQRNFNVLDSTTDEGVILTYNPGWTTRSECFPNMFPPPTDFCFPVPDIVARTWSDGTGKYTLLLAVKDTAGHTFFDIQRVWLDADFPVALITSIGGLSGCLDLRLSDFKGKKCEIRGVAWDAAIRAADAVDAATAGHPNDNFTGYSMSFQRNGTPGGVAIPPAVAPPTRVPDVWSNAPLPPGSEDVLAQWDIVTAIDGAGPHQLARGTRCAYNISLSVSDNTLRGSNSAPFNYAINIINDL
jgi:hypothetical protein